VNAMVMEAQPKTERSQPRALHTAIRAASGLVVSLLLLAPLFSCALFREDRCYVDDDQYGLAHDLFVQTGSLDIVEKQLNEFDWRRCKVNEVIYRLRKEFEVVAR